MKIRNPQKTLKVSKTFFTLDLFSHSLGENCLLLQKVCHKLFEGGGHKCLSTFFLSLLTPHTLTHKHHIRPHTYTYNRALPHSNTDPCLLHARSQTQHTHTHSQTHADTHSLIFKSINQLINTNKLNTLSFGR